MLLLVIISAESGTAKLLSQILLSQNTALNNTHRHICISRNI